MGNNHTDICDVDPLVGRARNFVLWSILLGLEVKNEGPRRNN